MQITVGGRWICLAWRCYDSTCHRYASLPTPTATPPPLEPRLQTSDGNSSLTPGKREKPSGDPRSTSPALDQRRILIISKPVWPMLCVSHRCEIIVFREVWAWATASSFADRSSGICVQPMMGTGGRQGGIEFWASVEAQLVELLLLSRRGIDQVYSSRSSSSMYSMENWPGGSPANDQWPLPPNSHLTIPIQGKINQKGSSYETLNRGAHCKLNVHMFSCKLLK